MKDFKGTPPPWEVGRKDMSIDMDNITIDAAHEGRCFVAVLMDYDGMPVHANAALIAAAPDLLQACIEVYDYLYDNGSDVETSSVNSLCDTLKAAITKALTI